MRGQFGLSTDIQVTATTVGEFQQHVPARHLPRDPGHPRFIRMEVIERPLPSFL